MCLVTGLPGSGKSVISQALLDKLRGIGVHAQIVSSDALRKAITPYPSYTEEERNIVYATIVFITKLLTQNGVNVIIDATANRRLYRDMDRKEISRFIEAYVRCPLEICIKREAKRGKTFDAPKNIYEKALTGKSAIVPGIGVPYEEPLHADLIVDSDKLNPNQCAQKILEAITKRLANSRPSCL